LKSELQYCNQFCNGSATKETGPPKNANFSTLIVWHGNFTLRYRKRRSRSIICTQNAFIWCKDCENRSRGSWDNCSPRNH